MVNVRRRKSFSIVGNLKDGSIKAGNLFNRRVRFRDYEIDGPENVHTMSNGKTDNVRFDVTAQCLGTTDMAARSCLVEPRRLPQSCRLTKSGWLEIFLMRKRVKVSPRGRETSIRLD
jgi:hypothetical protein